METPDLSTLSDNIDSTDDLLPSLQVALPVTGANENLIFDTFPYDTLYWQAETHMGHSFTWAIS